MAKKQVTREEAVLVPVPLAMHPAHRILNQLPNGAELEFLLDSSTVVFGGFPRNVEPFRNVFDGVTLSNHLEYCHLPVGQLFESGISIGRPT